MSLISKETLLTHLQRAEMASDVKLPIEFFRDLVYQAMPRPWVGLTDEDLKPLSDKWRIVYGGWVEEFAKEIETKFKEKNT
jgi:hypothetical protein